MPTFDSGSKSSRLLQSKRYTQVELSDSQEAFTRVLDLNASEIYVQQNLIPTSSLPFSGSSQNGNTSGVLKFYYRQRLTPSSVNDLNGKINTFFFISPTSSLQINNGVNPGILDANQQSNFISPKYAPSIANNTENVTPGYQVALTDDNGQLINPINYVFDYKMGVLEFTTVDSGFSGSAFSNAKLYLTAYQYTGLTLDALSTSLTASYAVTASYANTVKAVGPASAVQFSNGSIITGSNRLTFDNNLGSLSIGPGVNPYIAISNGNDTANLFPGILTLNTGGGIASSIYAASTASVVILPNEQDSTILATSVNGQFANNKGNITLTTVPSASYITSSFFTGTNSALSASYAATTSYAPSYLPLTGGIITGNITVQGTASIGFLNVTYESASVIYSSGSNQFGDDSSDIQKLFGTVIVTGSQQITGSLNVSSSTNLLGTTNITGSAIISSSLNVIGVSSVTGSLIVSSSSNVIGTSLVTGSLIVSQSSTVIGTSVTTGSLIVSQSTNLIGTALITGSLIASSSINLIGATNVTGSLGISGSGIIITGSINLNQGNYNVNGVNVLDTALAYAIALG